MSGNDTETSDWTDKSILKLLAAMKRSIPEDKRRLLFYSGMRHMDWKAVAFPPFSPEACQQKWGEILPKARKTRTYGELMDEAEDVICNPIQNNPNTEDAIGPPQKPVMNGYTLFCEEQKAGVGVPVMAQWWRDLTDSQKDEYNTRCTELKNQYKITLNKYLMTLNTKERQEIMNKHGISRSKKRKFLDGKTVAKSKVVRKKNLLSDSKHEEHLRQQQ